MKKLEDDMLESKSESQNVEFKKNWRDEYLQWVCGFANAQGGTLYVGVDDDGNVVGVEKAKNLAEDIPNKIISLMGIVPDVNILKRSGLEYLEIVVKPSNVAISLNGVYHYRCGATKQELRGTALQQFILKKMGMSWDAIVCKGATLKDIDRKAVAYFLEKAVDAQRLPVGSLRMPTGFFFGTKAAFLRVSPWTTCLANTLRDRATRISPMRFTVRVLLNRGAEVFRKSRLDSKTPD